MTSETCGRAAATALGSLVTSSRALGGWPESLRATPERRVQEGLLEARLLFTAQTFSLGHRCGAARCLSRRSAPRNR